jgi:hypothetical protein
VRIFKTKRFAKFAGKEGITDSELKKVVDNLDKGLVDAKLGGDVYKQRIARPSAGKSGGYRSIVFFKSEFRSFFVYGFAKSDRDNINKLELQNFKDVAEYEFAQTDELIEQRLAKGTLVEIN